MGKGKFRFALFAGRTVCGLTRILPGVSGTTWPGGVARIIDPNIVADFTIGPNTKVVMVTGTSGKTTTTGMLAQLAVSEGKTVCTNAVGANMDRGVATALIRSSDKAGLVNTDYIILEVDERYLPIVSRKLRPDIILITNVLKDQSQRNAEPGLIMEKISRAIRKNTHLILNANEPNTASLGLKHPYVSYYGVGGQPDSKKVHAVTDVACSCPLCGSAIHYDYENLLNIGHFSCTGCDLKTPDDATILEFDPDKQKLSDGTWHVRAKHVSTDFQYCYASLFAFAKHEGFSLSSLQKSIDEFKLQSGRVEIMQAGDKSIHYLRIKQETPVTLESAIRVTTADPAEKIVVFDLSELVDFIPNYAGAYYAYDCDYSRFLDNNVTHYICMSKVIACDEATRLVLEGVPPEKITVLPTSSYDLLLRELEKFNTPTVYLLTWMHSYFDCRESVRKYQQTHGKEGDK